MNSLIRDTAIFFVVPIAALVGAAVYDAGERTCTQKVDLSLDGRLFVYERCEGRLGFDTDARRVRHANYEERQVWYYGPEEEGN